MSGEPAVRGPVQVPREILDGLEAIRRSGLVNMLNAIGVLEVARAMGLPEVTAWVLEERGLYAIGVLCGFEAAPEAGLDA